MRLLNKIWDKLLQYYQREPFIVLGGPGGGEQNSNCEMCNTLVLGGAGSGKTASVGKNILRQMIQDDWAGFIYDYKDYDYTKTAWNLVQKYKYPYKFYYVSFTDMSRTYRFNILDKQVIETEVDLLFAMEDFVQAIIPNRKGNDTFYQAALGLIRGVAVRFYHLDGKYEKCCTLPHILNFILLANAEQLTHFLEGDVMAKMVAGAFLGSEGSDRTQSSIIFSINNLITNLATNKNVCYVLTGNDFVYNLVDPEDPKLFAVSNNFSLESLISPIVAILIPLTARKIEFGNRVKFAFVLDEMTSPKVKRLPLLPLVLRKYGVSFFILTRSIIQLARLYGESGANSIIAECDNILLGKSLNKEDKQLYESNGIHANMAVDLSSPGEFIVVRKKDIPFKMEFRKLPIDENPLPVVKAATNREIDEIYVKIKADCMKILQDLAYD